MKQQVQLGSILILEALGAILVLVVLSRLTALILLVLIAIVLTTGIDPLVRGLQRTVARWFHLPRVLAAIFVLLVGVSLLLGAVSVLVYYAVREAINVSASHPNLREHILSWTDHLAQRYPLLPNANALLHWVGRQSSNVGQYLWSTTQAVFGFIGGLFSVFMVLVLTIFFSTFRDGIIYNLLQLVPPARQARVREVARLAAAKMGGWLRGQVIMALIITTAIWPVMLALGLPYSVLIAVVGGIGELVPMVGPTLAFITALAIALLTEAPGREIAAIIVFFAVLILIEGYVLAPNVMKRNVELAPVTSVLALLTGGALFGLVGAVLAIPLTAAGRVIMFEVVFPALQGKTRQEIEAHSPAAQAGHAKLTQTRRRKRGET